METSDTPSLFPKKVRNKNILTFVAKMDNNFAIIKNHKNLYGVMLVSGKNPRVVMEPSKGLIELISRFDMISKLFLTEILDQFDKPENKGDDNVTTNP